MAFSMDGSPFGPCESEEIQVDGLRDPSSQSFGPGCRSQRIIARPSNYVNEIRTVLFTANQFFWGILLPSSQAVEEAFMHPAWGAWLYRIEDPLVRDHAWEIELE